MRKMLKSRRPFTCRSKEENRKHSWNLKITTYWLSLRAVLQVMTEGQYSLVWPEVRLVSSLLYGTLAKLFYFEFGSFENQKIHSLWPFPWKRSVWQNPDQVRTNQNSKIYWKTTLPYDNNKYCEDKSESISQRK